MTRKVGNAVAVAGIGITAVGWAYIQFTLTPPAILTGAIVMAVGLAIIVFGSIAPPPS